MKPALIGLALARRKRKPSPVTVNVHYASPGVVGVEGTDDPGRPPIAWFDAMVAEAQEQGVADPQAVVGDIWYHRLSERKREEIREREES